MPQYVCPMDGQTFESADDLIKHSKTEHGQDMSMEEAEIHKADDSDNSQ